MRRTMKKLLMLPVLALTFGMVACESNPTAPALEAPAAPNAARLGGVGVVIGQDSIVVGAGILSAPVPPPPPPKGGYELGWP